MTQEEIINTIRLLPLSQKVEILETVVHHLGEDLRDNETSAKSVEAPTTTREEKLAAIERLRGLLETAVEPAVSVCNGGEQEGLRLSQRLYGILKFEGEPPADEEIKNSRAEYLMEKYS